MLDGLSVENALALLEDLGGATLNERTQERIVEAAGGNPLFVEQLVALALERGPSACCHRRSRHCFPPGSTGSARDSARSWSAGPWSARSSRSTMSRHCSNRMPRTLWDFTSPP